MPARTMSDNAEFLPDERSLIAKIDIEFALTPIVGLKAKASDWLDGRERRRKSRTPLSQQGRYMLADRKEYPCRSADVSPVGIAIRGPHVGALGERVIAYFRDLGRLEGVIVRRTPFWFALDFMASPLRMQRIAEKIKWTLAHGNVRVEPIAVVSVPLLVRGELFPARVIAETDVAIALVVDVSVDVGSQVIVDGWPFRVVRRFDGGIAVRWDD
jgi:hypothetical protein